MANERRLKQRVRSEQRLRFGPEEFALSELLRAALQDRAGAIGTARSTAAGVRRSADLAEPTMQRVFGEALAGRERDNATLGEQLSRLGGAEANFGGAIAREQAGVKGRIEESLARTLAELGERKVEASAGEAFAVQQAEGRFAEERGQIGRRAAALAGEKGAFAQGRLSELLDEAAQAAFEADESAKDRALERRKIRNDERKTEAELTGRDPKTGRRVKSGDGFKRGEEEVKAQRRVISEVDSVRDTVRRLRSQGANYSTIRRLLNRARSEPKTNSKGEVIVPGNPVGLRTADNATRIGHIINAAINIEEYGYLGRVNSSRLRNVGLYAVPKKWKPTGRKRAGADVRRAGERVAGALGGR